MGRAFKPQGRNNTHERRGGRKEEWKGRVSDRGAALRTSPLGGWEPPGKDHPPDGPHLGQERAGSGLCQVTHWLGAAAERCRGEDAAAGGCPLTSLLVTVFSWKEI